MKAFMTDKGVLRIIPESGVEAFALTQWYNVNKVQHVHVGEGGECAEMLIRGSNLVVGAPEGRGMAGG